MSQHGVPVDRLRRDRVHGHRLHGNAVRHDRLRHHGVRLDVLRQHRLREHRVRDDRLRQHRVRVDRLRQHRRLGQSGLPGRGHPDFNELVNPADGLRELRQQLAGISNLVSVSRVYKSKEAAAADEAGGVALEKVVELDKALAKAIAEFHAGG